MKKYIMIISASLFLVACGGESEDSSETGNEETSETTETVEEEPEEVLPELTAEGEMAVGKWYNDVEGAIAFMEEALGSLPEEDKAKMRENGKDYVMDIRRDGTYSLQGMGAMNQENLNGEGTWSFAASGDTLYLNQTDGESMPWTINSQTEEKLNLSIKMDTENGNWAGGMDLIKK